MIFFITVPGEVYSELSHVWESLSAALPGTVIWVTISILRPTRPLLLLPLAWHSVLWGALKPAWFSPFAINFYFLSHLANLFPFPWDSKISPGRFSSLVYFPFLLLVQSFHFADIAESIFSYFIKIINSASFAVFSPIRLPGSVLQLPPLCFLLFLALWFHFFSFEIREHFPNLICTWLFISWRISGAVLCLHCGLYVSGCVPFSCPFSKRIMYIVCVSCAWHCAKYWAHVGIWCKPCHTLGRGTILF